MGAAPKLPPDPANQEAKKLVSVLSSQSVRFPSGSEKVFLAASEFEATRYANLDEILNAPALMRPGVVILEVAEDMDVVQAHSFLKTYEGAFAHGRLKAIVLTSIRHEDVRSKFKNYSVADFLIHPMPDRTFLFKVDLQFKIIGNQLESETMRRDPEFDLHSAQKKRNGKFALKVIGPSPSRGEWQMVNQSPTGAVRWRWVKKPAPSAEELEKELKKGEWLYEGEKEPVWKEEEKLWEMESADPVLEKLANGKKAFSSAERGWTARAVPPPGAQKTPMPRPHAAKLNDEVSRHRAEDTAPEAEEAAPTATGHRKEPLEEESSSRNDEQPSPSHKNKTEHSKSSAPPVEDRRMKQTAQSSGSSPSPLERKVTDAAAVKSVGSAPDNAAPDSGKHGWKKSDHAPTAEAEFKNRIGATPTPVPVAGRKQDEPQADGSSKNSPSPAAAQVHARENPRDNSKYAENVARLSDKRRTEMPTEPPPEDAAAPHRDAEEKPPSQGKRESPPTGGGDSKPSPPLSGDSDNPPMKGLKQKNGRVEKTNAPPPGFSAPDEIRNVTDPGSLPEPVARAKRSPDPAPDQPQQETKRGVHPNESAGKKLPSTAPNFDDSSKGAVAVPGGTNRQAADLKERHAGKIRGEEEIRLQATSAERAQKEKNLYKVVQERVHYFKSLEEMRDDSSTWERVEAYRVYIAASKKYYGVQSIQELLPVWIYVGEAAPEFIEERKSWLFWDRMPVEYHSIEEIPAPVLNYFLDLRNRDVMRRIEETRIRNLTATKRGDSADDAAEPGGMAETSVTSRTGGGGGSSAENSGTGSLPRSGHDRGEREADSDGMKVGRVEHVKKESLAERIIGFFGALFSRRK